MRLRPQKFDTGIGIGTIANHITQTPDLINRTHILQYGLESLQVAVNIRENQATHALSFFPE
jgi:hypothetical protein